MANIIERNLSGPVRDRFKNLIATGLGLFLALRFNDFVRRIVEDIVPSRDGLVFEFIVLAALTLSVVFIIEFTEKALDGR